MDVASYLAISSIVLVWLAAATINWRRHGQRPRHHA